VQLTHQLFHLKKPVDAWLNWLLFVLLCLIWGSSFILMKLGLYNQQGHPLLSAYEVAALRMLSAGLVLLPLAPAAFRRLATRSTRWFTILSGLLGSFLPAFLFCLAETRIDSSLAGAINAMTPLFVLLVATGLYGTKIPSHKWLGIMIGFGGCLLLFGGANMKSQPLAYGLLAVLATICYGLNVNMVKSRLLHAGSVDIATIAFSFLIVPSVAVLWATGYFGKMQLRTDLWVPTGASVVLGIFGTALASILFYILVKRAGIIFPSLVTYGIPFVAMGWAIFFHEQPGWNQYAGLAVILAGVYLANRSGGSKNPAGG
jgi:drug/metabolite transporter (DMT)-like permease